MSPWFGEMISLLVAVSWTATALFADTASHRMGALVLNIIRMGLSLIFLGLFLLIFTGSPIPQHADASTWMWLLLSGMVGYVFGDYCLFSSYVVFGSKYGQLMMTLAPPIAGIASWLMLGETMHWQSWIAMIVTLIGIAICVLGKGEGKISLRLPLKGILFGLGAALGQGVGLVLSKVGLEHYSASLPTDATGAIIDTIPFAGTFIRAIAGFVGFFILILLTRNLGNVRKSLCDGKGMSCAVAAAFFGPFIGVSLSLMAVQYTKAGIASTLMALTPVLIILPYSIIHHERIRVKELLGIAVTMIGVALFFLL